jgi:hypothetical protein
LEKNVELQAVVSWKNLRTGELLIDNKAVSASASFSEWQSQDFAYGSQLAANSLAERIVEQMETGCKKAEFSIAVKMADNRNKGRGGKRLRKKGFGKGPTAYRRGPFNFLLAGIGTNWIDFGD